MVIAMERKRRILPLIGLCIIAGLTIGAWGSIMWTRQLGGNLQVLVAQYGAELFEDQACTIVATAVSIGPTEQGQTTKSDVLYLKVTGGGRMFIFYTFQWLSVCTVQASAEYSWDGATWQTWPEGLLNTIDMGSGSVARVRWCFQVPAISGTGTYQYQITLNGDNLVPSG